MNHSNVSYPDSSFCRPLSSCTSGVRWSHSASGTSTAEALGFSWPKRWNPKGTVQVKCRKKMRFLFWGGKVKCLRNSLAEIILPRTSYFGFFPSRATNMDVALQCLLYKYDRSSLQTSQDFKNHIDANTRCLLQSHPNYLQRLMMTSRNNNICLARVYKPLPVFSNKA